MLSSTPFTRPAGSSAEVMNASATTYSPDHGEPASEPLGQDELDRLTDRLIEQFKTVFDPEIPVDVYELGLIYRVDVSDARSVVVDMTLTAPGCPVAGEMPGWVRDAVLAVDGVRDCHVNLVFEPPWDPSRMSDEAKLQLNMF